MVSESRASFCFLGKIFFHLLLINTVYTLGPGREPMGEAMEAQVWLVARVQQGAGPLPAGWEAVASTCLGNCPQVWRLMDPMDLVSSHSFL